MAMTSAYKSTENRSRVVTTEYKFGGGMKYMDNPLDEGYVKSLVNFDIKHMGTAITPRGGFKTLQQDICHMIGVDYHDKDYTIHHADSMFAEVFDGLDAVLCKYILVGEIVTSTMHIGASMLCIEYEGKMYNAEYVGAQGVYCTLKPKLKTIHGVPIVNTNSRAGIYTSLEGNTYMPVINNSTGTTYIGRLHARYNDAADKFTWEVKVLDPKEITATQAVNYGYNMLKKEPYKFENRVTTVGGIVLDGILPYDTDGKLKLSARAGEELFFHLIYRYPQSDVNSGKQYMVQWEIQNNDVADGTVSIIQQVRHSPVYTPGQDIFIRTVNTTYTSFTLICKVYYKDVVDAAQNTTTLADAVADGILLAPEQVIPVNYSYLTNESNSSMLNTSPTKYDLTTATGICTWQQRLVMWGVKNAKSTLFVSEINAPHYVPFPNNSEIFPDNIVTCIPYMTNLLVFTHTRLYMLTFQEDGLTYTSKCIQERLSMTEEDASTIHAVQNMVYFKSGNYFYMVVPNPKSMTGELQLAPVTRPIESMLDEFGTVMPELINEVYNIEYTYSLIPKYGDAWEAQLYDYYNILDNKQMRNIYKYRVHVDKFDVATQTVNRTVKYLDVSLNYDVQLRIWNVYMWEATKFRMVPYTPSVTQNTVYALPTQQNGTVLTVDLVQADNTSPADEFRLDLINTRVLENYQLLDTGFRNHAVDLKKRYRQIQFSVINTDSEHLDFYTGFFVDNDNRKNIYHYTTTEITDESDPNYGTVYVEREMTDPVEVKGLGELEQWKVDLGRFPKLTVARVLWNVSGKGNTARAQLLSTNTVPFEITNMSWVYRTMYGR